MKALRWILWIVGGLIVLAIVAITFIALTFDPNKYKPDLISLVKEKTGRTLTMDGNIGLTFFPKIGAAVEKVTLSEPNSAKVFAKIDEARVALALLPLLSKQVIVDQVTLAGLEADLVKFKDGRTNFDDLLGKPDAKAKPEPKPETKPEQPAGPPLAIDVGGIALKNATLGWRDETDGTQVRLSGVNLKTGRIASGVPGKLEFAARLDGTQPKAALQLDLDTGYRLDFDKKAAALSNVDLKLVGDAPGVSGLDARLKGDTVDFDPEAQRLNLTGVEFSAKSKDGLDAKFAIPKLALAPERAESKAITGEVKLAKPGETLDAKLALSALEAKGKLINFAKLDVDLDLKRGDTAVQGKVATPVTLNLDAQNVQLPGIAGDLTVSGADIPNKSMKLLLKGGARADWGKQNASAELAAKLDDSNIQAKLAVANWSAPAINFDVSADRLDVDRYLPPEPKAKPAATASAPASKSAAPAPAVAASGEKPIDLSALKTLNANGTLKVGALTASNIKAENVNARIRAADGKLDVNPLTANLYQGSLAGNVAVNANNNSYSIKQQLNGVSIGPLLRDAADKDILEGRGTVALDVTTAGATPSALKRALNGNANVVLKDGAIKGINLAETLRKAKAMLGSKSAMEQLAKGSDKTDFTDMTASFVIRNGVAHNEDLQARSPFVRLTGRGDIDIGAGQMNYTAQATIVDTSTGQGGKELAQLRGVTVPVQVSGSFDNLKYQVDMGALAQEAAKQEITRQLERRLGGGSGDKPGGSAAEQLLRGLIKRN